MTSNIDTLFELKLIEAIEKFIQKQSKSNNYVYNNVDFTSARSGELYYSMTKDAFYINQIKEKKKKIFCLNDSHKKILQSIYPDLTYTTHNEDSYKNGKPINTIPSVEIGFIIIHKKFILFFEKIYKRCPNSIFIICSNNKDLVPYCEENNYRYIVLEDQHIQYSRCSNPELTGLVRQYEYIQSNLNIYSFKTFVVPEGDAPIYNLINLYSKDHEKKTVCIQHGTAPYSRNGFKYTCYSKFLTWGEISKKSLSDYNQDQNFVNVGNHILDNSIENKTISFFPQAIVPLIPEKNYIGFLNLITKTAAHFPKQAIVVRAHPSHPLEKKYIKLFAPYPNITFKNNDAYTLDDVFKYTKLCISIFSSTLVEALNYDVIPVIVNTTGLEKFNPDLDSLGLGVEVKTLDAAFETIKSLIEDKQQYNKINDEIQKQKHLFFKDCGTNAIENILKEIL